MAANGTMLKHIEFTLDDVNYECQVITWTFDPAIPDGTRIETFCPDGVFIETGTPEPSLQVTFLSDWLVGGISDFLMENSGATADFSITHHPDEALKTVVFEGTLTLKAPPVGGEKNTAERTEITFQVGTWSYARGA